MPKNIKSDEERKAHRAAKSRAWRKRAADIKAGVPVPELTGNIGRMKYADLLPEALLRELYEVKRESALEIGEKFHISDWTVRNMLRNYGVPVRASSEAGKRCPTKHVTEEFLQREFIEKRRTAADIARDIGVAYIAITRRLRMAGMDPTYNDAYSRTSVKTEADELRVLELYAAGCGIKEMGRLHGYKERAVTQCLEKHGVTKRTTSEINKAYYAKPENRVKMSAACQKISVARWKGFSSYWRIRQGNEETYQQWRRNVLRRDSRTCMECGKKSVRFDVHHIIPCASSRAVELLLENGITLCKPCHVKTFRKERNFYEKYAAMTGLQTPWPEGVET